MTYTAVLRQLRRHVLDVVLPPRCLGCGEMVSEPHGLCVDCWNGLTFIHAPHCACCGLPFEYDLGDGAVCAVCARQAPPFERARAALVYDEASKPLVLAFKHADRTDTAPGLARIMARAGADLIADADLIAPVPLHWTRLFKRRFNQAALLAQGLDGTVVPDLLQRRKKTPSQGRFSRSGRQRNVVGAFALSPRYKAALRGKRVLLVDDVLTTGATVEACAKVLKRAGAAHVDVLTLTRVVRAGS